VGVPVTEKTTMLEYALLQDINAGKGVALSIPMAMLPEIITLHSEKRMNDVVYLNPRDIKHRLA